MKILLRLLLPILVIAAGYGVMKWLGAGKEEGTTRRERPARRLPQVEVIELHRADFAVTVRSQGVVRAHNSASLTPRVSGRVLQVHEQFEEGAFFREGDVLVKLDAADFEAALAGAEARLARAEATLAQEVARAEQALLDWRDLGYTEEPGDLVRRIPQLKEAEANVKAANADLVQARRDLERANVIAPYDGCVRERLVGPGQSVNPGTTLGRIFSTDLAEVRLPLAAEDLPFLDLPGEAGPGSLPVTLTDTLD
ncbi:MAG: efflux RND transporter periplasmic adaptor subunit, partial [Akkermansiaceae bacterium]|nr:efflux RND transporter periplasmic adaptor subunit [Akkermansiaceae bacterium]